MPCADCAFLIDTGRSAWCAAPPGVCHKDFKDPHNREKNGSGRLCENCGNLIPIGEGDHICDAEIGRMPLSDYIPTDDYLWCGGSQFMRKE